MKILMVCLGNICRSPMMQGWLETAVAGEPGLAGRIEVDSAAIGPWHVGRPPDPRAIAEARRNGVGIAGQRARQIGPDDFHDSDLILFADADTLHEGRVRAGGRGRAELARYLDWAGIDGGRDLADPYYGDAGDFERAWWRVAEGGGAVVRRLLDIQRR
ncbi:low molecular weight phosphotyrosine protein phosphatase [Lysobacter pythonis]|uniref:protein-tyrosine-phosphatase n=1 Tax=Solilutibacter pythonis TaxID=2483112 RepID=A0A3M2I6Q4_9GAMM|nr:low molecular weight protein-tyrosine-phosphatase [Lysobacter pythonis]RMH94892.1 low molecular weight phosphotyrosine protein phosphatase [Lysobacter pythonis]